MNKILGTFAVVCLAVAANAQNWTTVSASNITDLNQQKLAAGTLCFLITDLNDNPISVNIGGGGQSLQRPFCSSVTNGSAASFTVPNPANTAPANISYRVTATDSSTGQIVLRYTEVQFTGGTFNFDNYVPGFNLPLGSSAPVLSVGSLTITGSCTGCGSGGGGGYGTIQNAGTSLAQRATANFFSGISCTDNSGSTRTDCQIDQSFNPTWTGTHTFNGTANIAGTFQIGGAAPQGKIPIGNGSSYVPGDPLVQGTQAEGSTSTANPVVIGGYDTAGTPAIHRAITLNGAPAGTEYGIVTRNIPGGTQTVTGTVTANVGSTNGVALDATLTSGSLKAQGNVASASADSGNPVKVGGVFNATQPAVTNAQRVDAQFSNRGELLIAKGVSGFSIDNTGFNINNTPAVSQSGSWTVQPGNTANTTPWLVQGNLSSNGAGAGSNRVGTLDGIAQTDFNNGTAATQGRDVAPNVGTDGLLWTAQLPAMRPASYVGSANFAGSSTTDNACLPGNASNTVLLTRVKVSCTQTTAGIVLMKIIKRSTADSGGTSAAITAVGDDSNYSAAVSAPLSYTGTGPTVGTALGFIDEYYLGCLALGTAAPNDIYILNRTQKPIVLRGTAQEACVNFNNSALTGGNLNVTFEWIETKTIAP